MGSIHLLLFSLVLISVCFAGANYLAWRLFEHPRHALLWAVAYALAGLQYGLNLLRNQLPGESTFWILANSISFALVLCALWGHRNRLGLPTPRPVLLAVFAAMAGINLFAVFAVPGPGLRLALAPGFSFLNMTLIAVLLLRHGRGMRLPQNVAAAVHFLFGLTQAAAAGIALSIGPAANAELRELYQWANFTLMPSLFVAMGVSVIFLLATDLSDRLRALALTDPLTRINNRRGFVNNGLALLARAERGDRPVTLILCDLDHFKRINDRFGHSAGDVALQHFAQLLLSSVRTGDEVGRIGGEEFAVCLEDMDCAEAGVVAERIRRTLADCALIEGRREIHLTASFGICAREAGDDIDAMLQRADQALYAAKNAGRNKIRIAEPARLSMAS